MKLEARMISNVLLNKKLRIVALSFEPVVEKLLGCTRSRGRCWAANRMSHHPEPPGRAFHGRSINWTLKDNMFDGLFFCATLTGRKGGHTHLCKQKQKRTTPVRKRLSRTHAVLGRAIPGGELPVSGMKVWSLVVLANHSAFYWWSAQSAALVLLLSDELMRCCAASTNGRLDLRRRAFPLGG